MATEKFHYQTQSGAKITLPRFGDIPFGTMRKMRGSNEAEFIFALIEDVATPTALKAIDALPMLEVGKLFADWQKDSGVSVGESGASSTS